VTPLNRGDMPRSIRDTLEREAERLWRGEVDKVELFKRGNKIKVQSLVNDRADTVG